MKKLLFLLHTFLLVYKASFTKVYKESIVPKKENVFIKIKATLPFPFTFF